MRLRHLALALALAGCYSPPTGQSSSSSGGTHSASTGSGPSTTTATTGGTNATGGTAGGNTCPGGMGTGVAPGGACAQDSDCCDIGDEPAYDYSCVQGTCQLTSVCGPNGCSMASTSTSATATGTTGTTGATVGGSTTGAGVTGGTSGSNTCPGGFGTGVAPGGACAQDSDCCDIGDEPFYDYGCVQGTCQLLSVSGPTGGPGSSTGSTASTSSTATSTSSTTGSTGSTGGTGSTGSGWVDQSSTTCSFMNGTGGAAVGATGMTGSSGSTGGGAPPSCHWTGVAIDYGAQSCVPGSSVDCTGSSCTCSAPDGGATSTFADGTPGDCVANQQRCP